MIIKIADLVIEVKSRYRYTFDLCHDYIYEGNEKPVFTVFATDEQLVREREKSPEFTDDVIENTCIYRNICSEILKYDALFIHSAAISVDNRAYMFSANSGTGKTTHMNLWLDKFKDRAFIINGDKPIIRKVNGKFYTFGTPWCGKEGFNKNIGVLLNGICILERAENNTIVRADSKEALVFLLSQTTRPKRADLLELMLKNLGEVIEEIPIFKLGCNMESEACEVAYNAMSENMQEANCALLGGIQFIENIDKLHTTEMGAERIKRNLQIETDNVVQWCRVRILDKDSSIERIGKNWYVTADNCKITVNAHSFTIITAHKVK